MIHRLQQRSWKIPRAGDMVAVVGPGTVSLRRTARAISGGASSSLVMINKAQCHRVIMNYTAPVCAGDEPGAHRC